MSAFGSGSNSNGNFWYGNSTNFPGFLYKKNVGVGGRRSTKMGPGGNITCNSATDLYNKYKPGGGGVGASSIANRRAKNRLATVCTEQKCFPCYNTLGQYSNYTHNPNGFVPCPYISSGSSVIPTPGPGPSGTYTVTYFGNTNTGGAAPTDTNSPYAGGNSVTILGVNTLVKSGYQFAGWNTLADGTGTNYVGGDAFTINANTTLYANWIIGGVTLRYNAGTGGTGTAPSSSGTSYTAFSTVNVVDNASFTKSGSTFAGWNTAADGTGTSYPVGSKYTMPGSNPSQTPPLLPGVYLYAQWIPTTTSSYTLTYAPGTGGSGSPPPSSGNSYSAGSPANIVGNTGPFTNGSLVFNGWNTAADGTGTSYPAGSKITMTANTTLFAQWGSSPALTVTYDANTPIGATTSGAVPAGPTDYPTNVQVPILGQGSLITPGYTFLGWNESPTGAGTGYPIGYTFTSKTTTLYAQWAPGKVLKNCGTGTGGGSYLKYNTLYNTTITDLTTTTIYAMRVYGGTLATIGSGDAPYGIYSFVSKTVITEGTTTVNVYTTFINPVNNYNYSKTITNGGVGSVTYWPSGQTLTSITFPPFPQPIPDPQDNNILPNMSILTQRITPGGCGTGGGSGTPTGGGFIDYVALINTIILNFSDNVSSSTFAACHNYTGYSTSSNPTSGPWTNAINTYYPYNTIVETPQSYDVITILTITPSFGSQPQYVYPPLPAVTIEYYANGATGGMPPGPQYSYNPIVTPITLRSNNSAPSTSDALMKTGSTFSGWNTQADGNGTPYAVGASYSGTTSLKLYAKWV